MDLALLKAIIPDYNELRLIELSGKIGKREILLIGAVLKNNTVRLFAIEYEKGLSRLLVSTSRRPKTQRDMIVRSKSPLVLADLESITVGKEEYKFSYTRMDIYESGNVEIHTELSLWMAEFVKNGFVARGEQRDWNFSDMGFFRIALVGEYKKIPQWNPKDKVTLHFAPVSKEIVPVNFSTSLTVGASYPEAFSIGGDQFYINEVSFFDPIENVQRLYQEQLAKGTISPNELETNKQLAIEAISENVNDDERYLLIEYEANNDFSFCTSEYLDSELSSAGSGLMVFDNNAESMGEHGMRKRVALVQGRVKPDLRDIKIEIPCLYISTANTDIELAPIN